MPYIHINGIDSNGFEMTGVETDAAAMEGREKGYNRQCSIGWHDECSDPEGDHCKCPCHTEGEGF